MNYLVPIIVGSERDNELAKQIQCHLQKFNLNSIIRVCSAHKSCINLLKILNKYEKDDNVKTYITIAGKSNALSALVDGNSSRPIISCPPIKDTNIYDLYSSVSLPSGITPLTVLGAENAAIAAAKIYGLVDKSIENMINNYKLNMIKKLHIDDVKSKYENRVNITDLSHCVFDTSKSEDMLGLGSVEVKLIRTGKVRDVYETNEGKYYLVASDRISAFDRHLTTIPYKGIVLHEVSRWWFNKTKNLVPNHVINDSENRSMTVKKCKVFPIEFVMRSYLTGSTSTSIWKNYEKGCRNYCGHYLPDNMIKNQKLPKTLLTPTTKDEHDELISEKEILEQKIMTKEEWDICVDYSFKLFNFGQEVSSKNGLILVDTKYEFGVDEDGKILLVDELHTPDSSRYWIQNNYLDRLQNNKDPESIDKEIVRNWVKTNYEDPYDLTKDILVPDDLRTHLSLKYLQLYELITGEEFFD
jgi:phosphoribosylaminoimidazole-succinocarboxamide synthase